MLTYQRLREILEYDQITGEFYWRVKSRRSVRAGDEAGCLHHTGYWVIAIFRKQYRRGRLAWFYMTGQWPETIDHINRIKHDDRFVNLREATHSENTRNRILKNTTGFYGVKQSGERSWRAQILVGGKQVYLGFFDSPEKAQQAYLEAVKQRDGDFSPYGN